MHQIRSKLEIVLLSSLIAVVCCCSSQKKLKTMPELPGKQQQVIEFGLISADDISPDLKSMQGVDEVEQLLDISEGYSKYLAFCSKYCQYDEDIKTRLINKDFETADRLVRELAEQLKNDTNPYAKQYLEKVINFSYVVYKVATIVDERINIPHPQNMPYPPMPLPPPPGTPYPIPHPLLPQLPDWVDIRADFAQKIRVTPYTGERIVLETQVPMKNIRRDIEEYRMRFQPK